ncbi:hypothetical protein L1987_16240 [Smallanthus sonchifolius]|uniref:Uncharacterized protein n=1 Tax=Smallanthus sonchifolius TaxID=185202 RepID=A0ACB9J8B3_9ASTR|nr:hypothetical protein L1987_16240 [Smallanthus sonchifolius]
MLTITDPTTTAPAETIVAAEVAKLPIRYRRKRHDVINIKRNLVPCGHFDAVTDIAWGRCGEYLMSVSHDQVLWLESHKLYGHGRLVVGRRLGLGRLQSHKNFDARW